VSVVKATGGGLVYGSASGSVVGTAQLPGGVLPPGVVQREQQLKQAVADSQHHTLRSLLIESLVALGLLAVASLGLGWWIAGRVLRPVHRITNAARRLSEQTLHERIDLDGPNDELKELADTFDAMLGRLDRAFTSQRRFVANASHELRTPLATERVLIDEALANRGASCEELRAILEQLRVNSEETEGIIGALLLLARSERGIERWSPVDLGAVAGSVVARVAAEAVTYGVELQSELLAAPVAGDPSLLERLAGNLVENGVRHNVSGGWVRVTTATEAGWGVLRVSNSGRVLDPEGVAGLGRLSGATARIAASPSVGSALACRSWTPSSMPTAVGWCSQPGQMADSKCGSPCARCGPASPPRGQPANRLDGARRSIPGRRPERRPRIAAP